MKRMIAAWVAVTGLAMAAPAAAQTSGLHAAKKRASAASRQGDTQHRAPTGVDLPEAGPVPSALAADEGPPPPGLSAGWTDVRTRLASQGIGLDVRYISEAAANVSGGDKRLFREAGQLSVGVLLDLDKTVGLKGGAFQATVTWHRGRNLAADANLNLLQQVQDFYGRGQTVRVTQFWYEQVIGKALEVKLGLTSPGDDFSSLDCQFMNLSFCGALPGNMLGDYWGNWPVSQLGARARVALSKTAYVAAGVYQVNPRNLFADSFYFVNVKGGTGVLVPAEVGMARTDDRGHVASAKIGGWYSNANANDVLTGLDGRPSVVSGLPPISRSSRYGVYVNFERQLTGQSHNGNATSGLSVAFNAAQADRATSPIDNQVTLALFYRGLVPKLRGDSLGIAFARTNLNGRLAQAERLNPLRPTVQGGAEYVVELYYSIQPLNGLEFRPGVQWIHHPGGVAKADDVGVLGLKTALTL